MINHEQYLITIAVYDRFHGQNTVSQQNKKDKCSYKKKYVPVIYFGTFDKLCESVTHIRTIFLVVFSNIMRGVNHMN